MFPTSIKTTEILPVVFSQVGDAPNSPTLAHISAQTCPSPFILVRQRLFKFNIRPNMSQVHTLRFFLQTLINIWIIYAANNIILYNYLNKIHTFKYISETSFRIYFSDISYSKFVKGLQILLIYLSN